MTISFTQSFKCPLIVSITHFSSKPKKIDELIKELDCKSVKQKIFAIKQLIYLACNGQPIRKAVIPAIKFCFSSRNKQLKRLCYYLWEVLMAGSEPDTYKDEILLVCNRFIKDLQNPNEYIRCAVLRLLSTINNKDFIQMLKSTIESNLKFKNEHVRKTTILTLLKMNIDKDVIQQNIGNSLFKSLFDEDNEFIRSNIFVFLARNNRDLALKMLFETAKKFENESSFLKMSIIKFIKNSVVTMKTRLFYKNCLSLLQNSECHSVKFSSSHLLLERFDELGTSKQLLESSVANIFDVLNSSTDNNIKIYVLKCLEKFKGNFLHLMSFRILEIFNCFASNHIEINKRAIKLINYLITSENKLEVAHFLIKQLKSNPDNKEYKANILETIYKISSKFPETTEKIIFDMTDILNNKKVFGLKSVDNLIRKAAISFKNKGINDEFSLRMTKKLKELKDPMIMRVILWTIGEYSEGKHNIIKCFDHIFSLFNNENNLENANMTDLKKQIFEEKNYFLASYLASTVTKMASKLNNLSKNVTKNKNEVNRVLAKVTLLLTSILKKVGENDKNSFERISFCLKAVLNNCNLEKFLKDNFDGFENIGINNELDFDQSNKKPLIKINDPIHAPFFSGKQNFNKNSEFSIKETSLYPEKNEKWGLIDKLKTVKGLTGYNDPIYVESITKISAYDVMIYFTLYNRTFLYLNNINFELYCSKGLKIKSPDKLKGIPPQKAVRIISKVSLESSSGGIVFGNIFYETKNAKDKIIRLIPIELNAIDYLKPLNCSNSEFSEMWAEFEWENKIKIDKKHGELTSNPLGFLSNITNMNFLTDSNLIKTKNDFVSANLGGESIFGECILMNVSYNKDEKDKLNGFIRIRSKNKEMVVSLGNRVKAI